MSIYNIIRQSDLRKSVNILGQKRIVFTFDFIQVPFSFLTHINFCVKYYNFTILGMHALFVYNSLYNQVIQLTLEDLIQIIYVTKHLLLIF